MAIFICRGDIWDCGWSLVTLMEPVAVLLAVTIAINSWMQYKENQWDQGQLTGCTTRFGFSNLFPWLQIEGYTLIATPLNKRQQSSPIQALPLSDHRHLCVLIFCPLRTNLINPRRELNAQMEFIHLRPPPSRRPAINSLNPNILWKLPGLDNCHLQKTQAC